MEPNDYNPPDTVLFCRLFRRHTKSYMTYKLPHPLPLNQVDLWVRSKLPGWQVIHASAKNPDN
jgi:hypothetical protein